ncbi:MAG: peptidase T, partial [Rhodobacteraceae bacterium]|nr:peptidase T [Paracoccaceae bacterium]MCB2140701.1 peptidase T [Paracoccaceae bacterium]MCB2143812.1 peptidase T [Paracoccaceae bacterium]
MRTEFDGELEERLVRYAGIDTQSDEEGRGSPSTQIQLVLQRLLVEELGQIGAHDVRLTDYGAVLATIPGTAEGPVIGLLAHVDTAPAYNATGVKPRVIRNYNGGPVTYPDAPGLMMTPEEFPYLGSRHGHDIVT